MQYHHLGLHFDEFQLKISKFRIEIRFPKSDFRHSEQIKLISMRFKGITLPNDVKKCFTTYGIVMYKRDDKGSLVTSG